MRQFFNVLALTMVALIAAAVAIFAMRYFQQQNENNQSTAAIQSAQTGSSSGLPGAFAQYASAATAAEGDACLYAREARGAATRAEDEAEKAANFADRAESHTDGYGTLDLGDGTYKGSISNGVPDGDGIEIFTDGNRYSGQWTNGKRTGVGVLVKNGNKYEGHFEDNEKSESGVWTLKDGEVYEGQFSRDKVNGFGIRHGTDSTDFVEQRGQFVKGGGGASWGVTRFKSGREMIATMDQSKPSGPCILVEAGSRKPISAGYCTSGKDYIDQAIWPKGAADAPALELDQRCKDMGPSVQQ